MTKKSALRTRAICLATTTAASRLTGMAGATAPNTSGDVQESRRGTVSGALVMGAVVKSDGSLDRSTTSGITSAGARKGRYVVHFPIDVKDCTYVATIGKANSFGVAHPGRSRLLAAFTIRVLSSSVRSTGEETGLTGLSTSRSRATSPRNSTKYLRRGLPHRGEVRPRMTRQSPGEGAPG